MKIYIVRHGKSESNKINTLFNGNYDDNLTEQGLSQAKALGILFREFKLDVLFSSPLKRAVQTAQEISNSHIKSLPIITDDRLTELNPGIFDGLTYDEIMAKYKAIFEDRKRDKLNYIIPGGESYVMLRDRLDSFLREVYSKNAGSSILIVTHATAIKLFLLLLTSKSLEEIEKEDYVNTCWFEFDLSFRGEQYETKNLAFNRIDHLKNG